VLFEPTFHGLDLHAPWLKALVVDFARRADSPTRVDAIRLKDWLHLSFAYHFPPEQHHALEQIAQETIDPAAPVGWDLRFYERDESGAWICHAKWPLE
jgi:ubiquitin-associated SH3 domain-containing protein